MDTTTLMLLLGGAFVLYEMMKGSTNAAASTNTSTTTTNTTNSTSGNVQQTTSNQVAQQTINLVAQAMTAQGDNPNGYHTVDQFNYYYKQVRGVDGPAHDVLFPGSEMGKLYSIVEWWGAMQGQGFSGLGTIAYGVNPYHNPVAGLAFGSNVRANASERAVVKFNN